MYVCSNYLCCNISSCIAHVLYASCLMTSYGTSESLLALGRSTLICSTDITKLGDEDGHCRHWEARLI